MKRYPFAKVLLVLLSICLGMHWAFPFTIIRVDKSGAGDFISIEDAVVNSAPGDIILVAPGIYNESITIPQDLTLIGAGPNFTSVISSGSAITINATFGLTISGFFLSGNLNGISGGGNSRLTMDHCIIASCAINGISVGVSGENHSPVYIITECTIAFNGGNGVIIQDFGANGGSVEFHNNIVAFNGGWGVFLDVGIETLSYNNFHENDSGNYGNTTVGSNDVSLNPDPRFVDSGTGNFALLSNSPSKDAGRIGAAFNDPDGTRSDIGAYSGSAAAAF